MQKKFLYRKLAFLMYYLNRYALFLNFTFLNANNKFLKKLKKTTYLNDVVFLWNCSGSILEKFARNMCDAQKRKKVVHFSSENDYKPFITTASSVPSNSLPLLSRSSRRSQKLTQRNSPKNSLSVTGKNVLSSSINERFVYFTLQFACLFWPKFLYWTLNSLSFELILNTIIFFGKNIVALINF